MRYLGCAVAAAAVCAWAGWANATTISPGGTVSATVAGQASVYQIFGHPGNTGGDYGPAQDAVEIDFGAASGNIFTFDATGEIGCCGGLVSGWGPDGAGGTSSIFGDNGLSNVAGNALIPLMGVFTTDTDPAGGVAPAALAFDVGSAANVSPLLNQVFYIGDGHAGFNTPGGATLKFFAPTTATRLYLGVADAFSFNGKTGYYNDNPGQFSARVTLSSGAPEPAAWLMMIAGFGGVGAMLRRRTAAGLA
jgi:hypothetical protein